MEHNFLELISEANNKGDLELIKFFKYILEKYTGSRNLFTKAAEVIPYLNSEDLAQFKAAIKEI